MCLGYPSNLPLHESVAEPLFDRLQLEVELGLHTYGPLTGDMLVLSTYEVTVSLRIGKLTDLRFSTSGMFTFGVGSCLVLVLLACCCSSHLILFFFHRSFLRSGPSTELGSVEVPSEPDRQD